MQEIKINLTKEEKMAYFKNVLSFDTEDKKWEFKAKFSENEVDKLKDSLCKKLDSREYKDIIAAYPDIEKEIWSKFKMKPSKVGEFNSESLSILPIILTAFRNKLCDIMELNDYEPSQKTLEEVTEITKDNLEESEEKAEEDSKDED